MKIREMFIPYLAIGLALTVIMFFLFDEDRAKGFLVTYTVGYAAAMVFLEVSN